MMVDAVRVRWMMRWRYSEVEMCCIPYPVSERGAYGDRRSRA